MALKYHTWTIGCQMNEADSRRLAERLEAAGCVPAASAETADLLILNTCVIRQQAEDKIYGRLAYVAQLKKRRPHARVALMGCLVGRTPAPDLAQRFPFVDVFMPPSDIEPLMHFLDTAPGFELAAFRRAHARSLAAAIRTGTASLPPSAQGQTVLAYVPAVLGCSHACSYCIIPYRRGAEHSRPVADLLTEVRALADQGVREVTLLGQIVDRYGLDVNPPTDLADLLQQTATIPGIRRIRFLTSHPNWMNDRLLDTVADTPQVCPYIELPVQSGSDAVLARMRRGYTAADFRSRVEALRARIPDVAINTDVIVGFPGETVADFEATCRLLAELEMDMAHIAKYSPRPATEAARRLPDDVPEAEKERRRVVLEDLLAAILAEKHKVYPGRRVPVLAEERGANGRWRGRTPQNKLVFFEGPAVAGDIVEVTVDWAGPFTLIGHALE